ncbi:double-stranded RNA-binding protein 2-like [Pistacia vera]|uniref:double-stranded RNA-binding protein 2-like n=1 Tax=Pistacia vera TaxID=55513 RepID=UPI0012634BCA|nr:double-stranded RNA-binding protein 2-like [Pistacia vera]
MYKNQLQELAQRSCFNLPAYSCIREGPDHAPRFKATVNFNGETFESPTFCSTLRQAEHAAAEVALSTLANRGPSRALAARVLDETGVYKNLLQETAHKAGLNLPVYTTVRSGPGHVPVFSCTVELAGMSFTGEPARTKKQAQKNAAMAAWSTLKRLSQRGSTVSTSSSSSLLESKCNEEQEQVVIARFLSSLQQSESKHFLQNDCQYGHQRFIPMCRGLTPPTSSLYPQQCQSWAYPSFSPELTLCQIWQQEQLLQLQNHLLALPVSPTPPLGPQILPYMQSIFRPNHALCIPTRKQEPLPVEGPRLTVATSSPSLCFSSKPVPEPIRNRSTVTIQEIQEEKTEESSKFTPSVVPDAPVSVRTNAEPRMEQSTQEDGNKKIVDLESKISVELEGKFENVKYEGSQSGQSELSSHRNLDSGFRFDNLHLQNPRVHSYPRTHYHPRASSHRSSRPPSSAAATTAMRTVGPISSARPLPQNLASRMPAPPRMRTGVSSCSTIPSTERINLRQVHPSFMAPAVRIRTVVPVCSAPPQRQMPSSVQEATVPNREKKDTIQDVSTAASKLDNLHL